MRLTLAALLAILVSVTPAGVVTVATLIRLPVADDEICTVTVKVTVAPATRLTTSFAMLPVPLDVVTLAPRVVAVTIQVSDVMLDAASASLTIAPVTAPRPILLTTMV